MLSRNLTAGGFIDVENLMTAANAALAQDPKALSSSAYETALAAVLQAANDNLSYVLEEVPWDLINLYLAGQF